MENIFSVIIEMSIKATIVIVAVLLARFLLRKAPRRFSYFLWSVVGFRLCVPESYKVDLSFLSLGRQQILDPVKNVANGTTVTVVGSNTAAGLTQSTVNEAVNTVTVDASGADFINLLSSTAIIIWIIGMAVMIIYGIFSYIKIHRQMQNAILQSGNIYYSDRISAPFTLGFVRPKIYLPFGLNENEQSCIIAHERCHIKRLDHIVKLFAYILLSIHWFNPMCWVAFNRMSLDMEMSCDELIFRKESNSEMKKDYTRALVSIASKKRLPSPTPITFDDGRSTKKRVTNILNFKKPKLWINVLCYALCLFMLVACSADAESIDPKSVGNEVFGEIPYNIYYTSNGDGSCYVSDIRIDREYNGDIHLIIPEKSPEGETVTAVNWRGFNGNLTLNIPKYLTSAQFEDIKKMIIDSLNERDAKIVTAFYGPIEKNGAKYYEIEPWISPDEKERISKILTESGYTEQSCLSDTQEFLHSIPKTEEERKILDNIAFGYLYRNGNGITEITLPETLKYISEYAFYGCSKLRAVNGISDDCAVESKEIILLDKNPLTLSIKVLDESEKVDEWIYEIYNTPHSTARFVITPSKPIRNFKFLELDESEVLKINETLYSIDELRPSKPFLTNTPVNDATISHGISFTDEEGATRYFAIVYNGSGIGNELTLKEVSF